TLTYKGYLFVASVPGYVLRYCQFFPVKSSEAWGEFHERAFNFFGGIFPTVIYDNDSVLVSKVLGRERKQTSFSLSLEEHYGFDSKFCNVASGNEKGAVENAVGYCRRNYLPGLPNFPDWNRVNTFLEESCKKEIKEGIHYKSKIPLQDSFESMQSKLIPLLPKKKWYKKSSSRVNSYQLITTNKKEYSVPEKYVGTYVNIFSSVFDIRILKNHEVIAQHSRIYNEPSVLQLDHYLDQLKYKPSALWDCQAVQKHTFDPNILEIWNRLEQRHNKKEANYQFVKILLLGRKYSQNDLQDAIKLSLLYGAIDSSAVENIICQMNTKQPYFDIEGVKSLLPNIKITSWDFDLNVYKELSKGVF
ncbi:MAG: hypothetical protein OEL54_06090, partial [Flavobacteriaceae bacterium]|nr:hypothetical protein [Flavobacteriaceae bacterium]